MENTDENQKEVSKNNSINDEDYLKESLENNLLQSDNGNNQYQEEEMENNLINYEINNEEEDNIQNNIVIDSNDFNKQDIEGHFDNEENDEKNNSNDDNEIEEEKENNDDIALIKFNDISQCQCCKFHFNNKENLPYLFNCGHFFCIKCINQYFKDERGIICPSDGLVNKSIKELKLLKNLIINNEENNENINNNLKENINTEDNDLSLNNDKKNKSFKIDEELIKKNNKYCSIHKEQKLSHINCEDNKLLCIYCAFDLLKNNQKCEKFTGK